MKSWKPEVIADNSGQWTGNACRFATKEEAEAYVKDLMYRWLAVKETRVIESDDPVNYKWDSTKGAISITAEAIEAAKEPAPSAAVADRIDGYDRDNLGESPDY